MLTLYFSSSLLRILSLPGMSTNFSFFFSLVSYSVKLETWSWSYQNAPISLVTHIFGHNQQPIWRFYHLPLKKLFLDPSQTSPTCRPCTFFLWNTNRWKWKGLHHMVDPISLYQQDRYMFRDKCNLICSISGILTNQNNLSLPFW